MARMVFDVGGTAIKYSVMDAQLERKYSGEVPTPRDTFSRSLEISGVYADENQ